MRGVGVVSLAAFTAVLAGCGEVDDPTLHEASTPFYQQPAPAVPELAHTDERNVFFGDLHIHSAYSYDAWTLGVRALPDDAYRFCKGETMQHALGYPIRLSRPLDFASVTDHSEYLGVPRHRAIEAGEAENAFRPIVETGIPWRITLHMIRVAISQMGSVETRERSFGDEGYEGVSLAAWAEIVDSAERHNEPGRFTTFIGYEWSSMPDAANLHRNVIYRSSAHPDYPFSSRDSENPEDLWAALEGERARGIDSLAIPHNANVSNGRMYARKRFDGSPLTAEYAETRMRNEPISEILQVKGASETHPVLSVDDEFADFEIYDQMLGATGGPSEPEGSYMRDALKAGLEMSTKEGLNPYRFGVIGASDGHNASSPVEEDRYHGKLPMIDGTAGIRLGKTLLLPRSQNRGLNWAAMGLAAVWAEENTRASLFDALRRKESYATSGPRITVRFFGGWDLAPDLVDRTDFVATAYAKGVPMGGDLGATPDDRAPLFAVMALKDPLGANLDRIQIIKGSVDSEGKSFERIHDVAASGGRVPGSDHRVGPVGTSVDIAAATYTNTIGAASLRAVWSDPDFDPDREAFYYVRVLEIPTPRWSTYDAKKLGVAPPEPATIQERAITSAIWIRPR